MSQHGSPKSLSQKAVGVDAINRYLSAQSDFAFEMEILQIVKKQCSGQTSWGGSYYDIKTGKQREYDIRTELPASRSRIDDWLELAIECKNIGENYPLVISCTKRDRSEQKIDSWRWPMSHSHKGVEPMIQLGTFYRRHTHNLWRDDEFIGRALDQVGEDSKGDLVFGDEDIFNKWSQALNSTCGILHDALDRRNPDRWLNLVFLPAVVVPNGTLWQVRYDDTGKIIGVPKPVDYLPYWIGNEYEISLMDRAENYKIYELNFFTQNGLIDFLNNKKLHESFFCDNPNS